MNTSLLLLVLAIAYFLVCFVWRSVLVWKRTGQNPLVLDRSDSAHGFIGRCFKLTVALAYLPVVVQVAAPGLLAYLGPISVLESKNIAWAGIGLIALSTLWTAIAQAQMGNSWRVGIDFQNRTALVDQGLFRLSRNPIFLGMMVTLLGLFLAIPTAVSFAALLLGIALMQIQARLEEEYLAKVHGDGYLQYLKRVRRWI